MTVAEYGTRYYALGLLNRQTAPMEVEEIVPEDHAILSALETMAKYGVKYLHGRWLIEGAPRVLLFDLESMRGKSDEWKHDLWENAKIPSPPGDPETNDAILLGYMVAWFLEEFIRSDRANRAVIAHFHEWQAGVGLILARKRGLDVATIFTTHATLLGRYLCAGDVDFYNNLRF